MGDFRVVGDKVVVIASESQEGVDVTAAQEKCDALDYERDKCPKG